MHAHEVPTDSEGIVDRIGSDARGPETLFPILFQPHARSGGGIHAAA